MVRYVLQPGGLTLYFASVQMFARGRVVDAVDLEPSLRSVYLLLQ